MFFRRQDKKVVLGACLALVLSWASPLLACGEDVEHGFNQAETSKHLHSAADIHSHDHGEHGGSTPEELCEAVCDQMYSPAPALAGELVKSEKEIQKSILVSAPDITLSRVLMRGGQPVSHWPRSRPLYLTTERLRL